ncbi:MAG: polyprenyl diphosphate synthase [Patescibacteria group bacterium]|nr:polyprenyl diphosphate synthase [Patescibacteria group bacterium]
MSLHKKIRKRLIPIKSGLNKHAEDFAIESINQLHLPKSILIIPDGNGRWAKQMGLAISEGHKMGGKSMARILEHFIKLNIDVLGIWGFSEDNWKREKEEIDKIMEVMESTIKTNLAKLIKNNIKFFVLGKNEKIEKEYPSLFNEMLNAIDKTAQNTSKKLVLFVDYGERFQLEEFAKARKIDKSSSTYEILSKVNKGLPMFDMVLRTSGELRLSGFGPLAEMAEFVSVKKNLPDLEDRDIIGALKEYSGRQRRFGGR